MSGLSRLFSDSQFLKMVYNMVRFCEEELRRNRIEKFTALKSCDLYIVTLFQLTLPLLLQVNFQCPPKLLVCLTSGSNGLFGSLPHSS